VPVQVSGLTNVTAIAGGGPIGGTAYALESNGTVWSWGVGADGELGDGSKASTSTPVQVRGITNAVSIAAGELGGYAVLQTGRSWRGAKLASGRFKTEVRSVTGLSRRPTSRCRFANSPASPTSRPVVARRSPSPRGRVWAWGDGNLGNGTDNGAGPGPPDEDHRRQGGRDRYQCWIRLKTNGTVWAWGSSYYGEVGNGTLGGRYQAWPEPIRGLSHVIGIAASAPFAIVG